MPPTRTPKLAPYLLVHDAQGLVRFLERGLGGMLTFEVKRANGTFAHAEVLVEGSVVMVADAPAGRPPFPAMLHLYVPDADRAYQRALDEGARSLRAPDTVPDGDRRGAVVDAWGNEWWFTTPPKEE